MSPETSLHLVPRNSSAPKPLDWRRWRAIFQILTVVGVILVLVSLLFLLQGLGAGDVPQAGLRL